MQEKVEVLNKTFTGKVEDAFIEHCDRYLCIVQDATDSFFESVTDKDRDEMARIKEESKGGTK